MAERKTKLIRNEGKLEPNYCFVLLNRHSSFLILRRISWVPLRKSNLILDTYTRVTKTHTHIHKHIPLHTRGFINPSTTTIRSHINSFAHTHTRIKIFRYFVVNTKLTIFRYQERQLNWSIFPPRKCISGIRNETAIINNLNSLCTI